MLKDIRFDPELEPNKPDYEWSGKYGVHIIHQNGKYILTIFPPKSKQAFFDSLQIEITSEGTKFIATKDLPNVQIYEPDIYKPGIYVTGYLKRGKVVIDEEHPYSYTDINNNRLESCISQVGAAELPIDYRPQGIEELLTRLSLTLPTYEGLEESRRKSQMNKGGR